MRPFFLGVTLTYLSFLLLVMFSYGTFINLTVAPIQTLDHLNFRQKIKDTAFPELFYFPQTNDKTGAITHDKQKIWGDLTLFSTADSNEIKLINHAGEAIHTWIAEFSAIWPTPTHLLNPVPEQHITLARVFLDPKNNGDLYVMFHGNGDSQMRYGLAKLDQNSKVIWLNTQATHHDLAVLPDGSILTFIEKIENHPHPLLDQIPPPFRNEFLVILDKDGKEISRISLLDKLLESPAATFLKTLGSQPQDAMMNAGDLIHPNTITPIPDHVIGKAPMLKENSILLSFRNIDLLAILNMDTLDIEWAAFGPWKGQHSPRFMDNGHVVMFDNFGNLDKEGGASRIIEIDLTTSGLVWEYNGTKEDPFFSPYNSMIQILPNDNILVTETHSGRLFEVSRDKNIIWEYYAPERYRYQGGVGPIFDPTSPRIPSLFSAMRYKKSDLNFLKNEK